MVEKSQIFALTLELKRKSPAFSITLWKYLESTGTKKPFKTWASLLKSVKTFREFRAAFRHSFGIGFRSLSSAGDRLSFDIGKYSVFFELY